MTTREIYFKILVMSDLPQGLIGYTYVDNDGTIQVGKSVALELRTDETTVEKSINIMKEVENIEGFMFWNNSTEGEEFFKNNIQSIITKMF